MVAIPVMGFEILHAWKSVSESPSTVEMNLVQWIHGREWRLILTESRVQREILPRIHSLYPERI
jgi:hypothetical protein